MNLNSVLVEILVAALGVLVLAMSLVLPRAKKSLIGYFSAFALLGILVFTFVYSSGDSISFFKGLYVSDSISTYFKQLFIISAAMASLMSISYVKKLTDSRSEFFIIMIFATLGMMVMASANDLITLYIGLELMSISFIILTAYDKKSIKSTEAGTKYVLLNAMSTAVLLYGMSLLYGLSGSVNFPDIISYLSSGSNHSMVVLASVLVIAGFGFKISAAPFHMWSPDIYEGAPTPVTAFLAGGSKVAGFAVLIKMLMQVMQSNQSSVVVLIIALSILSMMIGNIIAIPQTNLKRMLAYSGVAHAGYILIGIVSYTTAGISAMLYYLLLYIFANIGAFASITAFSNQTGKDDIQDFSGMWKRSPLLTAVLLISLLSLAGIPPAAGFIGKFYLFTAAAQQGYLWMAFVAMGMSVVSIYYYIVVIRVMLMGEASDTTKIKIPASLKLVMIVSAIMILVMGLYPGPITNWTTLVGSTFMK
ncbi:MAG TPA: NADH-quinone oxidoreductase subunit N [Clostridia bacterium]|nr:NADH-quinone oxidoreductase subunit N [Clostridia bacterium]